ncbi:hypothetical protein [Halorarum salinum]|uniref:Uncharacterized protein n=1 Tax=Halorarum salinum TaxID=2743089 RepID=A0A7D5QHX1_9EURY|nr:hypothetical protein [Halobaculum salinum]QLG63062.1 hypothetical protein HUG12_15510 [Halobaculum salinum]
MDEDSLEADTDRYCPDCMYEVYSGDGNYFCNNCNAVVPYSDAVKGDDIHAST